MKRAKVKDKIFLTMLVALAFFSFALPSFADAPRIEVEFETNPLFGESDVVPGDVIEKWVKVTNNTDEAKNVITEAINQSGCDGGVCLADEMNLEIKDTATILYTGSFSDFLDAGEVLLGPLGAGEMKQYDFRVYFGDTADNETQKLSFSFDLLVGFEGEGGGGGADTCVENCDDNQAPASPGGSGGGGGNGPTLPRGLLISNEQALVSVNPPNGSAIISWDTDYNSTSQVIYGLSSSGPYTIDLNDPSGNFGYPFGSVEDPTKVKNHSVTLTGLIVGETYSYRVVSHASPPTISYEHTFTVLPDTEAKQGSGASPALSEEDGIGGSLEDVVLEDVSDSGDDTDTSESDLYGALGVNTTAGTQDSGEKQNGEKEKDPDSTGKSKTIQNLASVAFSLPTYFNLSDACWFSILFLLLLIFVAQKIWQYVAKRNNKNKDLTQILLFWIISLFLLLLVSYFFNLLCSPYPLVAFLLILILIYLVSFVFSKKF